MHISLAGISHNTAPLARRELAAVPAARLGELNAQFSAQWPGGGSVVLATCARTEVYAAHQDAGAAEVFFRTMFPAISATDVYYAHDDEAAAHLFQVAAGLDSPLPGENEIAHQLRRALAVSNAVRELPALLRRLFERALGAGRAVRALLNRGRTPASLLTAAVDRAAELADGLRQHTVVVGTGAAARGLLAELARRNVKTTVVSRRHYERACELAACHGMSAAQYEGLPRLLRVAGCVFSATDSPHAVITPPLLSRRRRSRPLLIFDLALPRDVAPGVAAVPGVRLLTLDDVRAPQVPPELSVLRTKLRGRAMQCLTAVSGNGWQTGTAAAR